MDHSVGTWLPGEANPRQELVPNWRYGRSASVGRGEFVPHRPQSLRRRVGNRWIEGKIIAVDFPNAVPSLPTHTNVQRKIRSELNVILNKQLRTLQPGSGFG